ncbi:hypothetical protein E0H26_19585 [Micromonospora zingiberis]|uniref:Uncharacterized protein n=1 Tax=Micromonospora zingiberis TaxID=2053011 RepID=A0A4R0GJT7_9ACTN|nr:hypothetical protein [Micromonospora zingiberis]TCB95658.1 hypothetical protein E0H26_19585 [Micromonospora zingiberis]
MSGNGENGTSSGSSPYNSDLAFGGSSSDSSLDDSAWHGRTGRMNFRAEYRGRTMERLARDLARLPDDFQRLRERAGRVNVVFGQAHGGGVGSWSEGSRGRSTIILDPGHADVRDEGASRLLGTAIFEIMNAVQAERRAELDSSTRRSRFAESAARRGLAPAEHYGREVERIEFDNAIAHRRLIADLPGDRTGTHIDLFRNTVPLLDADQGPGTPAYRAAFNEYYQGQRESGHTQDYENYYHVIGPPQPPITLDSLPEHMVARTPTWNPGAASISTQNPRERSRHHQSGESSHGSTRRNRSNRSPSPRR